MTAGGQWCPPAASVQRFARGRHAMPAILDASTTICTPGSPRMGYIAQRCASSRVGRPCRNVAMLLEQIATSPFAQANAVISSEPRNSDCPSTLPFR